MSDPYIVIEYADGRRVAQRVVHGTTLGRLENLWQAAWEDFNPTADERVRVGLGHGVLTSGFGVLADATKLSTTWLGYRDAKLPDDDAVESNDDAEVAR